MAGMILRRGLRERARVGRNVVLLSLIFCLAGSSPTPAYALPAGGEILAGKGEIGSPSDGALTVAQQSERMIVRWDSFDVAGGESVTFVQPGRNSVALNRIAGSEPSSILGALNANGQIFLINPNGILFGEGARVDVGGLIASSLEFDDNDFLSGDLDYLSFAADGVSPGIVAVSSGALLTAEHGYIVLIAPMVTNGGTLSAPRGSVAIGAGDDVEVWMFDAGNVSVWVLTPRAGAVIENAGTILADGGHVDLTMGRGDDPLGGVLNQSGTIKAARVESEGGRVFLLGPDVRLGGTLEAGTWVYVDAGEAAVVSPLEVHADWEFEIVSEGDVEVYADVTVEGTGDTPVVLQADSQGGGSGTVVFAGGILRLDGARAEIHYNPEEPHDGGHRYTNPTDYSGNVEGGAFSAYMLVHDIDDLQAIRENLGGAYALDRGIDASATREWNPDGASGEAAGFEPIGSEESPFYGVFDAKWYAIEWLYINRPSESGVGLFGSVGEGGAVLNVYTLGASVRGLSAVGLVAGINRGVIEEAIAYGEVAGRDRIGGVVGWNAEGVVAASSAEPRIEGETEVGGLVGENLRGTVVDNWSSGTVSGTANVGGLVGRNSDGTVRDAIASATVTGVSAVGGLVGSNDGALSVVRDAHSSFSVVNGASGVGGLVGENRGGAIEGSSAEDVEVAGVSSDGRSSMVGGLVGYNAGGAIRTSIAAGVVAGDEAVGGLVGFNDGGLIEGSYAAGEVSGASKVGGLVGENSGTIREAHADGAAAGGDAVGGLVGYSDGGAIERSHADVDVDATNRYAGGLVGYDDRGAISQSYARGAVNAAGQYAGGLVGYGDQGSIVASYAISPVFAASHAGGLVGGNSLGEIEQSFSIGPVRSASGYAGGLVGENSGEIFQAYATGSVAGESYVGGLVGFHGGGSIAEAYAAGSVEGVSAVGGLIGHGDGDVERSYWNKDASGDSGSAYGTPLATGEMMSGGTFAGWDFGEVWGIAEGRSYPYFLWRYPDGPHVVSGELPGHFPDAARVVLAQDGAILPVSVGADGFVYALLDPGDAAVAAVAGTGDEGTLAFRPRSGEHTPVEALVGEIVPGAVRLKSEADAPLSVSELRESVGSLADEGILFLAARYGGISMAPGADLLLDEDGVFTLDAQIGQADLADVGDILLRGRVNVAADSEIEGWTIELGETAATGDNPSLVLWAGGGDVVLAGAVDLGGGDLLLRWLGGGEMIQSAPIKAHGLALFGRNADFRFAHPENAISVLAGTARSIHYEQAGSLTVGQVRWFSGIDAEQVFIRTTGDASELAVEESIWAGGDGYAAVLAAGGRFVNKAGAAPFMLGDEHGSYLVYSQDPSKDDLGWMSFPGNLFGRTIDGDPPSELEAEFGGALGSRMVYAVRPTLTVRAKDQTREYGEENPAFGFTVAGLAFGDTVGEALTGAFDVEATAASPVGAYDIVERASEPFHSPLGYVVEVVGGKLEVVPRRITVAADRVSKVYGEPDPELTYTVTAGSLFGSDALSGQLQREPGEEIGLYAVAQGTLANPNYAITFVPGVFAIKPVFRDYLDAVVPALANLYSQITFNPPGNAQSEPQGSEEELREALAPCSIDLLNGELVCAKE